MMLLYYYFYAHMDQNKTIDKKTIWALCTLLAAGVFLRLWHLDYQSLWVDELYTIEEASTARSLKWLFHYLRTVDQHPPLYYLFLRLWLPITAYTEFALRLPSALAGTAAIYAIFLLGREFFNNRIGLIAALLATVNFFSIHYSQDGRSYIFIFLLSCISYTQLIRILKKPTLKRSLWYSLVSLVMIYTHYFSIFFLFGQVATVTVFFFIADAPTRVQYIKSFALSGIIIIIGYLPWIPSLLTVGEISAFWISPTPDTFLKDYFIEYFGNSGLLTPFLTVFLLLFLHKVFFSKYEKDINILNQPYTAAFIIILTWILGTCFIPYLRSLLVIPMLHPRYTTPLIPAYLIALAAGIYHIRNYAARVTLLVVFTIISLFDLVVVKKYYNDINKAQYREMTQFIIKHNPEKYPIVEQTWAWLHNYYFKRNNVTQNFIDQKKRVFIDSVMSLIKTQPVPDGFWFVDGHVYEELETDKRNYLETEYTQVLTRKYYGGWVELYYRNLGYDSVNNAWMILPKDFPVETTFAEGKQIAVWSNNPTPPSSNIVLPKGEYNIVVSAMGTDAKDTFAVLKVLMNGHVINEIQTTAEFDAYMKVIPIAQDTQVSFQLALQNNEEDPIKKKDRNAFVRFIRIKKLR